MSKKWLYVLFIIFAYSGGLTKAEANDHPIACNTSELQNRYDRGTEKATLLWERMICPATSTGVCDATTCQELNEPINTIIKSKKPGSLRAACETGGFVDRLASLMSIVCRQVIDCCQSGQQQGRIYGNTYCSMVMHVRQIFSPSQFVQPPRMTCDATYQPCCIVSFDQTTLDFQNPSVANTDNGCQLYVQGQEWIEIFDNSRKATCQPAQQTNGGE